MKMEKIALTLETLSLICSLEQRSIQILLLFSSLTVARRPSNDPAWYFPDPSLRVLGEQG